MAKKVKQWLVVLNEVMQDDDNANRYYGLYRWNIRHRNAHLALQTVKRDSKLITIATITVDDDEVAYYEFCILASKVNGLYRIDDILKSVNLINEYNNR